MNAKRSSIVIREVRTSEVARVASFVQEVFRHDVAPLYDSRGVGEFLRYASHEALSRRLGLGEFVLVATINDSIVGIIEMRSARHIAMLFVDPSHQRTGVGKRLLEEALIRSREKLPGLSEITVNAAPNSVEAYERYGFVRTGSQRTRNGIAFVPMTLTLKPTGPGLAR